MHITHLRIESGRNEKLRERILVQKEYIHDSIRWVSPSGFRRPEIIMFTLIELMIVIAIIVILAP